MQSRYCPKGCDVRSPDIIKMGETFMLEGREVPLDPFVCPGCKGDVQNLVVGRKMCF